MKIYATEEQEESLFRHEHTVSIMTVYNFVAGCHRSRKIRLSGHPYTVLLSTMCIQNSD